MTSYTWIGDDCPPNWERVGQIDVADPADTAWASDRGLRIGRIHDGGSRSVAEPCAADIYQERENSQNERQCGMIRWLSTERGFGRGEFFDFYGEACSVQESSSADQKCVWLGCDHETFDHQCRPCGARMHLTREMAREIGEILLRFADSGKLD